MGVRIIEGDGYAVLYCSTAMWAFGPVMEDRQEAKAFLGWLGKDPRLVAERDLEYAYYSFSVDYRDSDGNVREDPHPVLDKER